MKVVQCHDILRVAADLKSVTVNDCDQVVQFVLIGRHHSLIDRTFPLFSVTHDNKSLVGPFIHLGGDCHAHTD